MKHNLIHWPLNNITHSDEQGMGTAGDVEMLIIKRFGRNKSERSI
jgi:hypothetical protein